MKAQLKHDTLSWVVYTEVLGGVDGDTVDAGDSGPSSRCAYRTLVQYDNDTVRCHPLTTGPWTPRSDKEIQKNQGATCGQFLEIGCRLINYYS